MTQQHFNIIIVGDAPAGRLAGILLAREGSRILHLTGFGWPTYLLWPGSQLLDKLLDRLQARTCLTPPMPVQFQQQGLSCEIHGANLWSDEVRRELPDCYQQVLDLLDRLSEWGSLLQENLYHLGSSPATTWKQRTSWKIANIRSGFPLAGHKQSLSDWLRSQQASDRARQFISGLLSSYALDLPEQMKLTEAALIWSQLGNQHNLAPTVFNSILSQRLEDTGASVRSAFDLTSISSGSGRHLSCHVGKDTISCDSLIISGQPGWVVDGLPSAPQQAARPALWQLDHLTGNVSRLLAPRLLVDSGNGGFQVGIGQRDGATDVFARTGLELCETTELRTEMSRLFPFTDFIPMLKETANPGSFQRGVCGEQMNFQLDKNVYVGAGAILYPTLGPLGEVLTAMSLVDRLKPH